MTINAGDLVCHKSNPKKMWVATTEDGGVWQCCRVTDDDRVVTESFWDSELTTVGVLGLLDTLVDVARAGDEDREFIQEVVDLRERYAETLEPEVEPEPEVE